MSSIEWDVASIFEDVLRRVRPNSHSHPQLDVQFRPFVGMNHHARLRNGRLEIRLSDLLHGADARVIEALATILLAKLYRRTPPPEARLRYRRYLALHDVEQRIILARRNRGRKAAGNPHGRCYDLDAMFASLNQRYFSDSIPSVRLAWSTRPSRTRLGHYDSAHCAIVLSRSLDRPEVPAAAVEYILYHEMLHIKHPVERSGGRRRVHGPAFRAEEKRFPRYQEVRAALRKLSFVPDID